MRTNPSPDGRGDYASGGESGDKFFGVGGIGRGIARCGARQNLRETGYTDNLLCAMLTQLGRLRLLRGGMLGMSEEWWSEQARYFVQFLASITFENVKDAAHQLFWLLVLLAAIHTLRKLSTIREIIREFNKARGPIWDLRETIEQLTKLEPVIQQLGQQMELLYAKIEAAQKQVAELQVESISGRTEEFESVLDTTPGPIVESGTIELDDHNWEELRNFWRRNTQRIEFIIDQIKDGRSRISYDRMPRTNYTRIVDKLEDAEIISSAAATASRELFELFNRYRPKNRKVPDSVLGAVQLLDKQLDEELAAFRDVEASEDAIERAPPEQNRNVRPSREFAPESIAPMTQ